MWCIDDTGLHSSGALKEVTVEEPFPPRRTHPRGLRSGCARDTGVRRHPRTPRPTRAASDSVQIGATAYVTVGGQTAASVKQYKGCGKNYAYTYVWQQYRARPLSCPGVHLHRDR